MFYKITVLQHSDKDYNNIDMEIIKQINVCIGLVKTK